MLACSGRNLSSWARKTLGSVGEVQSAKKPMGGLSKNTRRVSGECITFTHRKILSGGFPNRFMSFILFINKNTSHIAKPQHIPEHLSPKGKIFSISLRIPPCSVILPLHKRRLGERMKRTGLEHQRRFLKERKSKMRKKMWAGSTYIHQWREEYFRQKDPHVQCPQNERKHALFLSYIKFLSWSVVFRALESSGMGLKSEQVHSMQKE